jgi:hypothetical protein
MAQLLKCNACGDLSRNVLSEIVLTHKVKEHHCWGACYLLCCGDFPGSVCLLLWNGGMTQGCEFMYNCPS